MFFTLAVFYFFYSSSSSSSGGLWQNRDHLAHNGRNTTTSRRHQRTAIYCLVRCCAFASDHTIYTGGRWDKKKTLHEIKAWPIVLHHANVTLYRSCGCWVILTAAVAKCLQRGMVAPAIDRIHVVSPRLCSCARSCAMLSTPLLQPLLCSQTNYTLGVKHVWVRRRLPSVSVPQLCKSHSQCMRVGSPVYSNVNNKAVGLGT